MQKTNSIIYGDLNGDGDVNSLDYTLMTRYLLGMSSPFTENDFIAADLNGDKEINSMDCTLLSRYVLSIISQFPVENQETVVEVSGGFIDGNNEFAFDIFKEISKEEGGENVFISPFAISTALSILYQGADSDTKKEMTKVLGYEGLEFTEVNNSYMYLLDYFNQLDENVKLKNSNSIWINSLMGNNIFKESFLSTVKKVFNAVVESRDFSDDGIVDEINNWISEATEGKIEDMLKKVHIDILSYIISAIYFNGTWTEEFDIDETFEDFFRSENNNTQDDVMMMSKFGAIEYSGTDEYKVVKLPYADGETAMYCILPNKNIPIGDFIQQMDLSMWNKIKNSITLIEDISLNLPRFKIDYAMGETGSIKESLEALGLEKLFLEDADFSNMFETGGGYIEDVFHKAVVEVNEQGTEAAGVVVIPVAAGQKLEFIANRPFIFVIADEKHGTILFMGKVCNGNFDN